jgi:hypothetical protein
VDEKKENNTGFNSSSSGGGMFSGPSTFSIATPPADLDDPSVQAGSLLSDEAYANELAFARPAAGRLIRILKRPEIIISLVVLGCLGVVIIGVVLRKNNNIPTQVASVSSDYGTQKIPLSGFIASTQGLNFGTSNVVVNGELKTTNGLVISPSLQPTKQTAGQLYFDQNTNQLAYYNGTQYIAVAGQATTVQSIGGSSGTLTLGGGLSIVGNQLSVAFPDTPAAQPGVSSFGGLTGGITVGRGLAMNGSDLQNSGLLTIAAATPNLIVNTDAEGNVTISSVGGGSGTVTSAGGTSGRIAKFTGVQNVEDSLLSDNGAAVTVNGDLGVTGTLSLSAPLSVSTGGTGAASLTANGVVIGQGVGALTTVTAGGAGLCLISTVGAPTFQACPSAGGVTSLDGLTGAITIANTTTGGSTITINDATTGAKGIASFNSTNLSVTAGTVNTIQNINAAATPTFAGVNTNAITPTGALTIGATGQNFTLQGAASSTITATNGGNTTTLSFQAATANVNYRFATTAAGTYDVCTTAGNCVGVGGSVSTPGGSVNTLAKFTGAQTLADSIISDNGTLATITGNASVTGSLTLGTALGVGNGGTGATTFTSNGVVVGQGSGALTTVTAGGAGECLISTVGAPTFQACPGSGGVTSVNGLTGVISIANASGAGATITINDATTAAKGIASFNSTNFSVASGAVNTIQNINTGAAPTFGQLALTSSQASNPMLLINNTNAGATGALLDLQVNGSSKFSVQPSGNVAATGTINGQTISGSASFSGSMAIAGNTTLTGDIAVNGGDITSTGALNITPTGTLTVGSSSQTVALQGGASSNFVVTSGANTTTVNFQAPTANVTYRIPTAAAGSYDICTTVGNCVGSGGGVSTVGGTTNKLAKFTGAQAIGDSSITDNGTTVTTTANMTVQGGTLTAGVANTQTGSLVLAYGSANFSSTITPGTLTANRSYTLPDAGGTFCLNGSSSCGFVTGSGAAFVQGGNTFGVDADLGTNDATALNLRTNSTTRFTINSTGNASFAGDVAVNGGDITSTGALNITPTGTLTAGSSTQTLALQGGASSSLTVTSGANTTTVNFQAPTANVNYRFATAAAGSYDVCTTTGNCVGTGGSVSTPGGTNNKVAKFTGSQVLGDSSITDNGTTVTTSTNLVIQGGTGTIGVAGSQAGTLELAYAGASFTGSLSTATLTANRSYTLPDSTGTFCLTSGNCLGPVGSGANISLSNLAGVAINTSLLPGATTIDLGAAGNGFRDLYLAGSSGTPASNYFTITGAATAARTITLPDATGTVCLNSSSSCGFATGSGAAFVNGGNSFGGTANLGTNSNDDLNLRTNSTTRLTVASDGSAVTLASNTDLLMQGASAFISNVQGTTGGESFGNGATTANGALAVGASASTAANGVAIGNSASASASSIALGHSATTTASNQMVIGADGFEIDHVYVGSGVTDATPTSFTLQGTGGNGSNVAGANVTIAGGAGTGNANGGNLNFQIAKPSGSSSTPNTPTTVLSLSGADGSAQFKSTAAAALEVQTAGGTPVFTVNTSTAGIAVAGTASATGNINSSGAGLQTAGTTRVDNSGNLTSIGNITGASTMAISASGTMTIGNTGQTLALQGNASTTLSATGGGQTTTVGFSGSPTGAVTYNFDRAAAAGTYTICTSIGNCSGAAATLQSVYNNSSTPEIVLDGTRGALTLRDNSTPLGANLFEVQDNGGSATYFGVTASGVSVSGAAAVTGNINSSSGALQTGGTTRVDNSGNLTNIGNITGTGAITIASSGAGNDITIDGADQFIISDATVVNGMATFNTDTDFTLAGAENIALTSTVTGTTAINLSDTVFTNNTTSGTQNIARVQNAAGTGTTEAMFVIDNADTDTAVNDGLIVTSAAGTIADALDVSDTNIVNALNFGANTIIGTTGDIDTTYFDLTGSTGSFTSAGTGTLQGGTITVGTNSQAGSAVLYDGSSNTGTIQTAALAADQVYTLPATGGTVCIQASASCSFAPTTGGTGYIQNQSAGAQSSSSFWISSTGRIDGGLTTNNVTSSSGALTLQAATNVISLGGSDTLNANGGFTIQSGSNSDLTVNANGTGTLSLGSNATSSRIINVGATGSQANTSTVNIGTSTGAAQTVSIGSTNGTGATTIKAGSGGINLTGATNVTGNLSADSFSGAGLTDCDSTNSKLLWDTTTKLFSCGTDKPNVMARKSADQSFTSTTYVADNTFTFAVNSGETWAFQIHAAVATSDTTNALPRFQFTAPASSTCAVEVSDLYMVENRSITTCGNNTGSMTAADTNDNQYLITGSVVAGANGSFTVSTSRSGASGTVTTRAGGYMLAYKLTGADLAEAYYTKDATITPGTVVRVDGSLPAGVAKTSGTYDAGALGIVSTEPGYILADNTGLSSPGTPVLLALNGRVPVKVSLENGPIEPGDYLTTSSTPGVAMKATRPGQMIGKALAGFDSPNPNAMGAVMTFVNLTWADPHSNVTANNTLQGSTTVSGDLNVAGMVTADNLKVNGTATIATVHVGTMAASGEISVGGTAKIGGDLAFQGAAQARNAITKRFVASKPISVGAVVIMDAGHDGQVTTTATPADTRVIGIAASAAQQAGDTIDVAIGGTIQARTAAGSHIQAGDLVTSASEEGDINTVTAPTPGALVGKALGKPEGDGGLAWVLVTLD